MPSIQGTPGGFALGSVALGGNVSDAPQVEATVVESIRTLDAASYADGRLSAVAAEGLRLRTPAIAGGIYGLLARERVRVRDTQVIVFEALVTEALELEAVTAAIWGVRVREPVALATTVIGNRVIGVIAYTRMRVSDRLLRHITATVLEELGVGETLANISLAVRTVLEELQIGDTVTPRFLLQARVTESVDVTASQALQMLYSGKIVEGVEIGGGYIGPDGTFTTWTMNPGTGAVTEYTNYDFNSFARVRNKYLGASADGLYELLGDDDDGDDIIATIRGGYMQFGGVQQSRLKAAYLAVRGDGDFVLKIETAEGATYNYAVDARSMRTTKVHMGKGQRARYFAYELTGDGTDFDLESLEFVPLVVQRRV